MVSVELWWLHDDEHEQGHDSGRLVTPDGVEVAAAFAVVLVKAIGVAIAVELRVAGVCARPVRPQRSAFFCRPP